VLASSIPGLSMQFPNANVQTLKRTPWTELLGFLGNHGEDIMISLLLDCGIFICLDHKRSLYYQLCGMPILLTAPCKVAFLLVTGKPLSNLEPIDQESEKSGAKNSAVTNGKTGQKLANSTHHGHRGFLRKPNSIVFVRRRMFYARPVFNAKGEVRFGLKDSRKHCKNIRLLLIIDFLSQMS
jgi:telomerase reverse transcriptase